MLDFPPKTRLYQVFRFHIKSGPHPLVIPGGDAGDGVGVRGGRVGDGALYVARLEVEDAEGSVGVADDGAAAVGQQVGALGPLTVTWKKEIFHLSRWYRVTHLVANLGWVGFDWGYTQYFL